MLEDGAGWASNIRLISRMVTVSGRRMPVHLDLRSWTGLERIAMQEGTTLAQVCAMVADRLSDELTLSAGLRAFVAAYFAVADAQDEDRRPLWAGTGLPVAVMAHSLAVY